MNKVIICLIGCLLALGRLQAQDNARQTPDSTKQSADTTRPADDAPQQSKDTLIQMRDSTIQVKDTTIQLKDTAVHLQDTTIHSQGVIVQVKGNNIHVKDTADSPQPDSAQAQAQNSTATAKDPAQAKDAPAAAAKDKDSSQESAASEPAARTVDKRWFISPLLKGQFQDFAFLEKNRKGYLSDANTLPFLKRGNASFAASAYKNLTGRLSISADIGLSFGHVTNDNKLISQTQSKTYNLLNATIYYHLLSAAYRFQPYISIGINDIINDASYASAPIGLGAKFNAKKIMVMGQISYGYAVSKNISNTTMYGLGIYIPIKSKKQKQLDAEDNSPYNRSKKDKDTASKTGSVINNIYITIKMDSLLKAQGLGGNGKDGADGSGNRKGGSGGANGDEDGDGTADGSDGGGSGGGKGGRHSSHRKNAIRNFDFKDFSPDDYKVDTINGEPVIRFVVYFEFNEYALNSKAFSSVDRVISHLQDKPNLYIEIKGYTDDVGTEQYNNFLSRRRAKMVLDYMNSRGVPSEWMKAKAYGSDDPVGDNKDPNQAWLNRRAEIIVHEK